jgi:hypothetical protein
MSASFVESGNLSMRRRAFLMVHQVPPGDFLWHENSAAGGLAGSWPRPAQTRRRMHPCDEHFHGHAQRDGPRIPQHTNFDLASFATANALGFEDEHPPFVTTNELTK